MTTERGMLDMMSHLRIESENGDIRMITHDGKTILPDVLTVRLESGRVARVKIEQDGKEPQYLTCNKFFGNGGR